MQTRATPNTDAFHAVHFREFFDSFFHSSTIKYQNWRAVWKIRCYKSIYYQPMLWWDYVLKILDNTRSFVPVFVQIWITCNQNLFTLSSFTRSLLPTVFWDFSSFWNFRACQQINNIDDCSKRFSLKQLKILSNLFFFLLEKMKGNARQLPKICLYPHQETYSPVESSPTKFSFPSRLRLIPPTKL